MDDWLAIDVVDEGHQAFLDGTVAYWASINDCRACAYKPRCTKGAKRIVTRNLFEPEREHVRALKGTEAFERRAREVCGDCRVGR